MAESLITTQELADACGYPIPDGIQALLSKSIDADLLRFLEKCAEIPEDVVLAEDLLVRSPRGDLWLLSQPPGPKFSGTLPAVSVHALRSFSVKLLQFLAQPPEVVEEDPYI